MPDTVLGVPMEPYPGQDAGQDSGQDVLSTLLDMSTIGTQEQAQWQADLNTWASDWMRATPEGASNTVFFSSNNPRGII